MVETNALDSVRAKLANRAIQLEKQLQDVRTKLRTIDGALGILFEEGEDKSPLKVVEMVKKDRYKNMKLTAAVKDCVNTYGDSRALSAAEVKKLLLDNGLKNTSKSFYSTVFIALKRLADKGEIAREEGKGFKKLQRILTNEPQQMHM